MSVLLEFLSFLKDAFVFTIRLGVDLLCLLLAIPVAVSHAYMSHLPLIIMLTVSLVCCGMLPPPVLTTLHCCLSAAVLGDTHGGLLPSAR